MHRVRAALLVPAMAFFGSALAVPVISATTTTVAPVADCIANPIADGGGCLNLCPKVGPIQFNCLESTDAAKL